MVHLPGRLTASALPLRHYGQVIEKNVFEEFVLSQSKRRNIRQSAAFVAIFVLTTACGGGSNTSNSSAPTPPVQKQFVDVTAASGINYTNGFVNDISKISVARLASSGAATGDYDNDGDIDIFIVRGDVGPNLLYRNTGNLVFEDVADVAGIAYTKSATENFRHSGPMFADMDGDGDLDLFLGGLSGDPSLIFANNGDGTFSDVTAGSGIARDDRSSLPKSARGPCSWAFP